MKSASKPATTAGQGLPTAIESSIAPIARLRRRSGRLGRQLVLAGSVLAFAAMSCAPFGSNAYDAGHKEAHWSYEGSEGPEHWAELAKDFDVCATGKAQSPIDVRPNKILKADWLLPLEAKFNPTRLNIVNNGHTIQVNYDRGTKFEFEKQSYELKQFHFHGPSEHKINGNGTDMEMHLVWSAPGNRLAVIGIMIIEGRENPFFAQFWHALPEKEGAETRELKLNVEEVLPSDRNYFHYDGSLTTPPCAEGVKWILLKQPVTASRDQISRYRAIFSNNARPVQQTGERLIKESQPQHKF